MSAPKSTTEMTAIPLIVLDDPSVVDASDITSPFAVPLSTSVNGPGVGLRMAGVRPVSGGDFGLGRGLSGSGESDSPEPFDYVPHRCNSDIGLPTASMPNLTLAMGLGGSGGEGSGGDKLGVYCSPRTTRRSVDLDMGPREVAGRQDYSEWLEERTSSLRVLSAGSRVGSAVSLTSVCTAHSVGLLSNDSDDDFQDASLHDGASSISGSGICLAAGGGPTGSVSAGASVSERAGQLRRLQSYPEEQDKSPGPEGSGVTPRTFHSLCNLKAVQAPSVEGPRQLTPEKLCLLPSDLDEGDDRVLPPGEDGGRGESGGGGKAGRVKGHKEGVEDGRGKSHIVSYGKGSQSLREGRIRRWLQDMDKATD